MEKATPNGEKGNGHARHLDHFLMGKGIIDANVNATPPSRTAEGQFRLVEQSFLVGLVCNL